MGSFLVVNLYYVDNVCCKKLIGTHLSGDGSFIEFDVEIYNGADYDIVHVLYSRKQNKVFERNPRFDEDIPGSKQYIPFRYSVVGIEIKQRFQIDDTIMWAFN